MTEFATRALLPAGLRDILPPQAAHEADVVSRLMARFTAQGYERVKPPLIEFDTTFAPNGFRVMDPLTQRMMAVRSDITPQVARIAAYRMANQPRPLRLAYAGQVLRVKGTQLRAERQFGQVGIELIGTEAAAAEAEILALCAEALAAVGLNDITVDLTLATLVPLLLGEAKGDKTLRDALDHKDVGAVSANGGSTTRLLTGLIEAVGPAERGLERLKALDLPPPAAAARERLVQVVGLLREALPDLTLTIDPVENRGFEYHTGVGFTIFCKRSAGEIGRGGRYSAQGEAAVGATLFMDTILEILPEGEVAPRLYLPHGCDRKAAARLREEGWVTIQGLAPIGDFRAEAKRLRCSHMLAGGRIEEIAHG